MPAKAAPCCWHRSSISKKSSASNCILSSQRKCRKQHAHLERSAQKIRTHALIEADATEFVFPKGPCVAYLFNPFGAPVLRRILKQMEKQFKDRPRDLDILYVNHERENVIKTHPAFKQLWRGNIPMSSLDAIVDLQIINSQLDGEYGSTGDEACSIYRFIPKR